MAETSVEWRDLEGEVETTLRETFGEVRATVRKNMAALVIGLVMVLRTPRGLVWQTYVERHLPGDADEGSGRGSLQTSPSFLG